MSDYEHQDWPAWFYGPDGEAAVFESEADVPAGWTDHPLKAGESEAPKRGRPKKAPEPVVAEIEPDLFPEPSEF